MFRCSSKFQAIILSLSLMAGCAVEPEDDESEPENNTNNNAPQITLAGPDQVLIEVDDEYVDPGFIATDEEDGDITSQVEYDLSRVDTSSVGAYPVVYEVSDSDSMNAIRVRTVRVMPLGTMGTASSSSSSGSGNGSSSSSSSGSSNNVSSSSSSSGAGESPAPGVDSAKAIAILQDHCSSCHFGVHSAWSGLTTDLHWSNAQNRSSESYIDPLDPENSLILERIKFYGAKDSTMPLDNAAQPEPFTQAHYDTLVNWVKTFAAAPIAPIENSGVTVDSLSLTELGFDSKLSCDQNGEDIQITLLDPARKGFGLPSSGFTAIRSRDSGLTEVSVSDFTIPVDDGSLILVGEGLDIWGSNIFYNALRKEVVNGKLDITLDIQSVTGVNHPFSKVGIMVSDSDDLSGQNVFVHWSGKAGLAEDSGVGVLNDYRQIEANNNGNDTLTSTPARLRVAFQNNALKVGGCLNCDNPSIGLPKAMNFKPTHVFILASSHATSAIEARVAVADAYSTEGSYGIVAEESVKCVDGEARVLIDGDDMPLNFDQLFFEARIGETLVASTTLVREFSQNAACEVQDELAEPKLRRLSQRQIQNSIVSVFGDIFPPSTWPDMEDGAKLIGMNNSSDRLNINNLNAERLLEMSQAVADAAMTGNSAIAQCSQTANSECVEQWLAANGKRLWRRPLSNSEITAFETAIGEFSDNPSRLKFVINSLLLSSDFLFRSEIGQLSNGTRELDNFEIVSALSYSILNTTPSDTLLALAAQTSSQLSVLQLKGEVARMLQLPEADEAMLEVYKDYLKLDLVLSRPKSEDLGFTAAVRGDVLLSAERMLLDNIEQNMAFTDVFLSNKFYVNDNIDYLFDANVSGDWKKLTLDASRRQGILNHPAFLAVHSTLAKSGIVKRGVFALEQLLCQELPDPPGDVMPVELPAEVNPEHTSERELLQISHSSQAGCQGCHQIIDPAGFGFENYDTIGRYRTEEKGNVVIDASGTLDNVGEQTLTYETSAQYAEQLANSPQMNHCVSKRFLENYIGQDLSMSACELKAYRRELTSNDGSVHSLLYALIELESFTKRQAGQ